MQTLSYTNLSDKIQTFGRTWYDREEQTLYANYTWGLSLPALPAAFWL